MPNAPTDIQLISAEPGSVVLQVTGEAGVDHYDVYRSTDESLIGDKINNAPIAQPVSPYTVLYTDDVVNSTAPPVVPTVYFYRFVAVDAMSNISLPSDSLNVQVGFPQDITPGQPKLISIEVRGN